MRNVMLTTLIRYLSGHPSLRLERLSRFVALVVCHSSQSICYLWLPWLKRPLSLERPLPFGVNLSWSGPHHSFHPTIYSNGASTIVGISKVSIGYEIATNWQLLSIRDCFKLYHICLSGGYGLVNVSVQEGCCSNLFIAVEYWIW